MLVLTNFAWVEKSRLNADPKADHLGCAALPRQRIGAVVDRVTLAGRSYDCAAVKDTTVCHWVEAGTLPAAGAQGWR